MEDTRNTEENKSYIHCPKCDKMLIQAATIVEGTIKCDKCHRRYLLSVQEGSVFITLLSKSKDEN